MTTPIDQPVGASFISAESALQRDLEQQASNIEVSPVQTDETTNPTHCYESHAPESGNIIAPFSLLDKTGLSPSEVIAQVAAQCHVSEGMVEDVFPCTPLQEGMMSMTVKQPGKYVRRWVFCLASGIAMDRVSQTWDELVAQHSILRTRIVQISGGKMHQAVLAHQSDRPAAFDQGIDQFIAKDDIRGFGLGTKLARFGLVTETGSDNRFFVLTIHHTIVDGVSISMLLKEIELRIQGSYENTPANDGTHVTFQSLVKYQMETESKAVRFWGNKLEGSDAAIFPKLPSLNYDPTANEIFEYRMTEIPRLQSKGIRLSTAVWAAWSILQASYTNSSDIVFGVPVTGRQRIPIPGIEKMMAPTVATIPLQLRVDWGTGLGTFLQDIQTKVTDLLPFSHVSLQNIRQMGSSGDQASRFQTILGVQHRKVVQPPDNTIFQYDSRRSARDLGIFNNNVLMIECQIDTNGLHLLISFDSLVIKRYEVSRIAQQLEHVLRQICVKDSEIRELRHIETLSTQDSRDIQNWNATCPVRVDRYVHDLIAEHVKDRPEASAICAWDGNLTYRKFDSLSTQLAVHLMQFGVCRGSIVPMCVERSMWTFVSMLAVMKTRAAFVLLDEALPLQRMREIVTQTRARVLVSSKNCWGKASATGVQLVIKSSADAGWLENSNRSVQGRFDTFLSQGVSGTPADPLYIAFTSGSTGKPKGAVITHSGYASVACAHKDPMGLNQDSRMLHFASYSFDASNFEALTTFIAGGCLCIPSEEGRKNDLSTAITTFRVNTMFLTPTVSRLLTPSDIPTVKTMLLGGEPITDSDIAFWNSHLHLKIVYGPTECSAICCCLPDTTNADAGTIGFGTGARLWVVDPFDHHRLSPVGAIGELILEGPVIGNGYLNDTEKTAVVFVDRPNWHSGIIQESYDESFSWYRTGDLVQYRDDGLLKYVGRKDQQVKLNGQRFELAEVEINLRKIWKDAKDIVAAIIIPAGGKETLVSFVWLEPSANDRQTICKEIFASTHSAQFSTLAHKAQEQLYNLIPSYMVPALFIPLHSMPQRASGKIDKTLLCSHAATFTRSELELYMGMGSEQREAETWAEKFIGELVQDVLLSEITPVPSDNFFRLGGDSVVAMKLIQRVRRAKMTLNISDIFQSPKLCDLASLIQQRYDDDRPASSLSSATSSPSSSLALTSSLESSCIDLIHVMPLSMVNTKVRDEVFEAIWSHSGMSPEEVEDIYPCTPLQEGLMSLSIGNPGTYIRLDRYLLPSGIDPDRVKDAWREVINVNPILRTRIYQPRTQEKALQIVLRTTAEWRTCEVENLQENPINDIEKRRPMGFLDPLLRLTLINERKGDPNTPPKYLMEVTLHHAIYDSLSLPEIFSQVEASYRGESLQYCPFAPFIQQIERSLLSGKSYWSTQFDGTTENTALFPPIPHTSYIPRPTENMEISMPVLPIHWELGYTINIQLRASWAMTMFQYTSSNDVVFGVTVTGRNGDLEGFDQVTGPTFATIPIRAIRKDSETVEETLSSFQNQMIGVIPFEQYGLQNISSISKDAARACSFQTLLLIQSTTGNAKADPREKVIFSSPEAKRLQEGSQADTYALTIECAPQVDSITVKAIFDSTLLPTHTVRRLLRLFSHVFCEMAQDTSRLLGEISMINKEDQDQIASWNSTLLETPSISDIELNHHHVCDIIKRQCDAHPTDLAVCAWDGNLTYRELDQQSATFASHLVRNVTVGPGAIVPLCFEKSIWTTVAMLGVMRAGAAFVLLDPSSQPLQRMQDICKQVNATVITCSESCVPKVAQISDIASIVLDGDSLKAMRGSQHFDQKYFSTSAVHKNALYVVFTSGSTGQPKGIVIEHGGYATTALARQSALGLHRGSRVLQFASYAFDVSIENTLDTLIAGGCVCVPSESQRKTDFVRIADEFQVTYADLTPSVARLLSPSDIPTVETMVLGGEAMASEDIHKWASKVRLVNAYGPAECAVTATVQHVEAAGTCGNADATNIGRAFPTAGTWVVDQLDHNKLLPIGITGELVIEGPLVGRGYLDCENEGSRSTSFLQNAPAWRSHFSSSVGPMNSQMYLTGDLVQYNVDGSLKYLGRKDQQVKINGQRIELGEIESQIRIAFPSAIDVLVDLTATSQNTQRSLISFVCCTRTKGDAENCAESMLLPPSPEFRDNIAAAEAMLHEVLPRYMIPTIFIPVRSIPQTASAKADRRALCQAASALSLEQMESYMTPRNKSRAPSSVTEKKLQGLWAKVLGISPEKIKACDGFFRVGGNSILAMRLAGLAKLDGISLSVPDLFENKSLEALAIELDASTHVDVAVPAFDWKLEAAIPSSLDEEVRLHRINALTRLQRSNGGIEIILTGSTGHLGGEILRQLVTRADISCIHCVAVRRPDQLAIPKLSPYGNFDWKTLFEIKVKIYLGDLSFPRIGLSDEDEATILSNSRAIIHCGALVSFVRSYGLMRDTNVNSTKYLAGLAVKASMAFHFISTVGVNVVPGQDTAIIEETSAKDAQPPSDGAGGYIASKWVSEAYLEQVSARYDIPVVIHRPSNVVGPNASKNDIINNLLTTCRRIDMVPNLRGWAGYFDLISAEAAASSILSSMDDSMKLKHEFHGAGGVKYRHESGGAVIPIDALKSVMEQTGGRQIQLVDLEEWTEVARRNAGTSDLVLEFLEMRKGKGVRMPLIRNNRMAWFAHGLSVGVSSVLP